ncbi:MAG TPA: glycoside hydrolase family 125 protein [Terracidiphilus sp.]|nr:glycoside hydrolase family 125 protein [Terracidiphilus sp.]
MAPDVRRLKHIILPIFVLFLLAASSLMAASTRIPRSLGTNDVLPTGNQWISLPDIRAGDGALGTFNFLSMHHRGLLQVSGDKGSPVLQPYFTVAGKPLAFQNPTWELIQFWIPTAHLTIDGLDATLTWCAPPESRAAFLRMTLTNHRTAPADVTLGVRAAFGSIDRVTYVPVALRGERIVAPATWVEPAETFSYITSDTDFSWTLLHPGSKGTISASPTTPTPSVDASQSKMLGPGETIEANFVLSGGIEEFSAAHNARALREQLERSGSQAILDQTAAFLASRARTTGKPDLDLLMNRNFLFTEFYAWGRTIDTEQLVGITSRSPRYYVSAAYWDRDAMLWSFPALLDSDPAFARDALEYALTIQLRNTGTHSRFIDGVVLEDGFQLDEAAAPIVALAHYIKQTDNTAFLASHQPALNHLRDSILARFDPATGLYSSLQDSQDEFQKLPFITYDNALVWRALTDLADLYKRLNDPAAAEMAKRASSLHDAILTHCVSASASGADGTIFASATDGKNFVFTDIPPGSLFKLPLLGFVPESDPVFVRTSQWLHSKNYQYSYGDQPYGLPGSYRVPFTTAWSIADQLRLKAGHDKALKILLTSNWDGGIITEGVDPSTARMDQAGRAFATAAGYVAHAICQTSCTDQPK